MLLIAMTLVAGFAVFGYVRLQANVSELSYAQSVGGTMSYLQERFVVAQVTYTATAVTVYIYTNGQIPTQFAQIEVYGPTRATLDVTYDANYVTVSNPAPCRGQTAATTTNENPMIGTGTGKLSVKVNYVTTVVLTLPACAGLSFTAGNTYFIKLLGTFGNTAVYYQAM
jgi:hypothetical protein